MRKRVGSRVTSTYVDAYSDELYQLLLRNAKEARELRKYIRKVERELAALGYEETELSSRVMLNLDFARANMKANIYDQAVLEGVATTYRNLSVCWLLITKTGIMVNHRVYGNPLLARILNY